MTRSLPTPGQILEELADKTAAQIERLAPVAFDAAWDEMTRYHRFLLALNSARTNDGKPINYAEVAGSFISAPHQEWIRQYRRLFERAATHMPDDSHFIRSLAYAPHRLMKESGSKDLPAGIVTTILGLGPMMMHQVQNWVTKRRTLETPKGEAISSRVALAGSDAKAYENVLPHLVGAWESLLGRASSIYSWRDKTGHDNVQRWSAMRASWPFLWGHLTDTAYCLAVAVWNEDEVGARMFREVLVRWPQSLWHGPGDYAELRHSRLLFPNVLNLDWPEAVSHSLLLAHDHMPPPSADRLFASVVRASHQDTMILTAALLLFWTINKKQPTDIGARTARALLRGEAGDAEHFASPRLPLSFRSLLLDFLRLDMAGERYQRDSYGNDLDRLVETLDNMTERQVVPGRVYTPSTLKDRDDLLVSLTTILTAWTPDTGDDGALLKIVELAQKEEILPDGDHSLRNMVHQLGQFRLALDQSLPEITRGVSIFYPGREIERGAVRLRDIVASVEEVVETERSARLKARSVDNAKVERLRSAIETSLLKEPTMIGFFRNVQVARGLSMDSVEWCEAKFTGIRKASLVDPPMEVLTSNFEEMLVSASRERADHCVWEAFTRRRRTEVNVVAQVEQKAFWQTVAPLVQQVGPDPVLVVSRATEGRTLRRLLYGAVENPDGLRLEGRAHGDAGASYIVTVEGVDVLGADFPKGLAWLFSARSLESIHYAELDSPGRYADVEVDFGEDIKGILRVRFRQTLRWADTPIFELKVLDPDDPDC
jgi:hypothetical protein